MGDVECDSGYLGKAIVTCDDSFNFYGCSQELIEHPLDEILPKTCNDKYGDGEQMRDFIYVEDCVNVIDWILNQKKFNGLYNVGSGVARKFIELATSVCASIGVDLNIKWIDTPSNVRAQYQYFTEANMGKLISSGYQKNFYSLEEGIKKFIEISK